MTEDLTKRYVLVFEPLDPIHGDARSTTPEEIADWVESQLELTGPDVQVVRCYESRRRLIVEVPYDDEQD